jgi:hypothetical protein
MKRRRVLVVAMLDSIHTARWLSQFKDEEIDFLIVASKKFKHAHPNLLNLSKLRSKATFQLANFKLTPKYAGYLDFLFYILIPRFLPINLRLRRLSSILKQQEFQFVHALEIQGAGYLVDEAIRRSGVGVKFILTNWGSDIYYFEKYPEHRKSIESALQTATHYSAECNRDYALARELGFVGIEMPCVPNAGGFDLDLTQSQTVTSTRTNIVAKTYGGDFGRGDLVIESLHQILDQFTQTTAFLYSVTDDLAGKAEELKRAFPSRVEYSGRRTPLSRQQMRELFLKSRVYIGASRTDGISTSFLEAVVSGCYPIQTNTSCAGEWVNIGAVATLVGMDIAEITNGVSAALTADEMVDQAQVANLKTAQTYLSSEAIQPTALSFYRA